MKTILKRLKRLLTDPRNRTLVYVGLGFGFAGSILSSLSSLAAIIFSWLLLLAACVVGYYQCRRYGTKPFSKRIRNTLKGGILFVIPSSAVSFIINFFFITLGNGWGFAGVSLLSISGIMSLLFGIFVGVTSQLIIFVIFGVLGSLFVRK